MGQKGPPDTSRPLPSRSRGGGRGRGKPLPEGEEGFLEEGRKTSLDHLSPRGLVGFILVVRGDTPTSSHFSDAIAAGCIPVIVSNGFFQYGAPFNRLLNLQDVIASVDEDEWVASPTNATEEFLRPIPDKKQETFERFDAVRHSLLWEPSEESQRTQNAATAVLTQWKIDCGP